MEVPSDKRCTWTSDVLCYPQNEVSSVNPTIVRHVIIIQEEKNEQKVLIYTGEILQ